LIYLLKTIVAGVGDLWWWVVLGKAVPTMPRDTQPVYNLPLVTPQTIDPGYSDTRLVTTAQTQRDYLAARYQGHATGSNRSLWVVRTSEAGVQTSFKIEPNPTIDRVGTKSRPYRLLSGKEIQLSEDDFRVNGVSRRYPLASLFGWGVLYVLDPVITVGVIDLDASTVCDLIMVDDSNPIVYQLTLKRREDSRNSAQFNYHEIP
jgi:hypothetical protein